MKNRQAGVTFIECLIMLSLLSAMAYFAFTSPSREERREDFLNYKQERYKETIQNYNNKYSTKEIEKGKGIDFSYMLDIGEINENLYKSYGYKVKVFDANNDGYIGNGDIIVQINEDYLGRYIDFKEMLTNCTEDIKQEIENPKGKLKEQVQKLEFKGKNFTGCSTEDKNGYLFILI